MLALVLGGLGAGGYYLYTILPPDWFQDDNTRKLRTKANFAYFAVPAWRPDEKLLKLAGANLALSRASPRGHLVIFYTDYKFRLPSDEELIEEAVKRLKVIFRARMEYIDPLQSDGKGRKGDLGGEPALAMTFNATGEDNVPMAGECQMLARRGYAYWFVAWAPEEDIEEFPDLFEKLRGKFVLDNGREGWKPTPRPAVVHSFGGLRLSAPKEVWEVEGAPKDYDSAAELVLRGYELALDEDGKVRQVKLSGKLATVQVLALPAATGLDAAVNAAKEHVEKRLPEGAKLEPFKDRGSDKPIIERQVGTLKGEAHHLEIKLGKDSSAFGLLGVVSRPEGVIAIFCECPMAKRGYWLAEFKEVLASVGRK